MKKYLCEGIGTLVLVFCGCFAATAAGAFGMGMDLVVGSLAFGFSIVAMFFTIGKISGCHLNPAVSFAMFLDKRLSGKDFIGYVISQFIGALVGAALLFFVFNASSKIAPSITQIGIGANGYGDVSAFGIDMTGAIIVEVVLTFIFVLAVLGSTANKNTAPYAGIIIGLSLALVHCVGIPLTGTSVNPARSFGPAVMSLVGLGNDLDNDRILLSS